LFVGGVTLARTELLPPLLALVLLLGATVTLLLAGRRGLTTVLLFGFGWGLLSLMACGYRASFHPSWQDTWHVEATIASIQKREPGPRLRLSEVVRADGERLAGMVDAFLYDSQSSFLAGQRIALDLRMRPPDNARNPGAFDYRAWCFDQHVALTGSVIGRVTVLDAKPFPVERFRQRLRDMLDRLPKSEAAVLHALLLGERAGIDGSTNAVFSATGTAHLLAISGLHMGMAAAWVFAIVWWLLTRREVWIVHLPVRKLALSAGMMAAIVYGSLAGWPLPAQRAAFMLAAGVLAWVWASHSEPLNTLLAALLLILIVDPGAVSSLSLWLSFLATAAILLWALRQQTRTGWRGKLVALAWISVLSWLVTLPLVLAAFGRLPLYGLPANLLLVPWYGVAVMPPALLGEWLTLAGWQQGAFWLLKISAGSISLGQQILHIIAGWPASGRIMMAPPWWGVAAYALLLSAAGAAWWKKKSLHSAGLAVAGLLVLLVPISVERPLPLPTWMVWDVGQGAASSLLMPDGGVMVVDVPGSAGSRFNGGSMVAEGLRTLGRPYVEVLVLSHAQSDHMGGAVSLLQGVNGLQELWLADVPSVRDDPRVQEVMQLVWQQQAKVRWLSAGDSVSWHGVKCRVLWPPRGFEPANANNASLVLHMQLGRGVDLLLPADIEAAAEASIALPGRVSVMLVPHHGSRTSSTAAFVQQLHPQLAVVQTGRGNRYHFPDSGVVTRYRQSGALLLDSSQGAVELQWVPDSVEPDIQIWVAPSSWRRESALQWWQSHL